jgi:anti-sigma B factor antagonist
METLRVSSEQADDRAIRVVVAGELDLASAPRIEEELQRVEEQNPSIIVLDLRELQFMDSTGLRTIVNADARAREAGRRLVVVRGTENVQRVFEVTRLNERVEIVDDPSEVVPGD